jgi:hypothetical protein
MKSKVTSVAFPGRLALLFLVLTFASIAAQAKDLKYEALLIWATNAENSPDRSHKPVSDEVLRKLRELPLKWKNYFVVTNVAFVVPPQKSSEVTLSDKCKVEVKDVDGRHIEVSLIGKGEPVLKRTQPLPVGKMLVLGGNAPNETGWLVALKRVE